MQCLYCKYDLRNLTENRCPECGALFDSDDPRTYFVPQRKNPRRWLEIVVVSAIVYLTLLTFVTWHVIAGDRELWNLAQSLGRQGLVKPSFWSSVAHAASLSVWMAPFVVVPTMFVYFVVRVTVSQMIAMKSPQRTRTP